MSGGLGMWLAHARREAAWRLAGAARRMYVVVLRVTGYGDEADAIAAARLRTYPPEPGTNDRSVMVVIELLGVTVYVRRRAADEETDEVETYVNVDGSELPEGNGPLVVSCDAGRFDY